MSAPVNWLLMLATLGLVVAFRSSDNLASAYGVAVAGTMLLTSMLLFHALREIWHWSLAAAIAVMAPLALVDAAFFASNLTKIVSGGYVPLLLALAVYGTMAVWHTGVQAVNERLEQAVEPLPDFIARMARAGIPRVPGTAVFLTRTQQRRRPSCSGMCATRARCTSMSSS